MKSSCNKNIILFHKKNHLGSPKKALWYAQHLMNILYFSSKRILQIIQLQYYLEKLQRLKIISPIQLPSNLNLHPIYSNCEHTLHTSTHTDKLPQAAAIYHTGLKKIPYKGNLYMPLEEATQLNKRIHQGALFWLSSGY